MASVQSDFTYDVVIVGAGFGGMTALRRLRESGLRVRAFEVGDGVGGTWYWNRYPGARVDIESLEYSLPFPELQDEWSWSEKYAAQPELQRYMDFVADRYDLRRDIQLQTRVNAAIFDEEANGWNLTVERSGEAQVEITSRYVVLASGFLSVANVPDIPGLSEFKGTFAHTAGWPVGGVDLEGKRVGIIGTAASGIQVIQTIAPEVERLTVFQRTANWVTPLRNEKMRPEYQAWVRENYDLVRATEYNSPGSGTILVGGVIRPPGTKSVLEVSDEERQAEMELRWQAGGTSIGRSFNDLIRSVEANDYLRVFYTKKIRELVVDPETARKLTPTHAPFTRRPPGDSGYYETFNRDNVDLVDIRVDPIARIARDGVELQSGAFHELDVLILATGFDAGGGAALAIDIRGRGGRRIQDHWADGVRTELGMMTNGFPNLFFINGAQSPAIHFSPPLLGVYQAELIDRVIERLSGHANPAIEPTAEAEDAWTDVVWGIYNQTLIPTTDSWWMGANVPGKPRRPVAFAGGFSLYKQYAERSFSGALENYTVDSDVTTKAV